MRLVQGQGWVKESELLEKEKAAKEEKEKLAKQGSKLKHSVSMMERVDSRDGEGNADEDVTSAGGAGASSVAMERKMTKGKEKANGTMGEGGMISPESLEAI